MTLTIRRHYTFIEHHPAELPETPLRKVAVVGIVDNPYDGRPEADLQPSVDVSAELGRDLAAIAVEALAPYHAVSCGIGGIVGMGGQRAHVDALLTETFMNALREVIAGEGTKIASCSMQGGPGSSIDLPVVGKLTLDAAPAPGELAVIVCVANR